MSRPSDYGNAKSLHKCINKLNKLYNDIPDTKGCMENLSECKAWCCQKQSPSLFFVEFMNAWDKVYSDRSPEEIVKLIDKAIRNYVFYKPDNGCIFFDNDTKHCMCHDVRPYNCRIYGITPKEEFEPRYKMFKERYKGQFVDIRDQCSLVSTKNGKKVNTKDTDGWWKKLCDIEHYYGIPKSKLNDGETGTYRNFHDHILLYLFPEDLLRQMTILRLDNDLPQFEKERCVQSFVDCFEKMVMGFLEDGTKS